MKIGLFSDTFTPQINGVTTILVEMQKILKKRGHEPYIFAPAYSREQLRENGNVYRFPALKFIFHKESRLVLPFSRRAASVFKELEVVHSHTPFGMGLVAMHVMRKYDLPHLHTYHTHFTEYRHYLPRPFRPTQQGAIRIVRAFCNRCDALTTPSQPMKEELLSYGIHKPIHVVTFGVDLEPFEAPRQIDPRALHQMGEDEVFLLYAGRLGAEKNNLFLLRAFRRMVDRWEGPKKLRLVLAGDGTDRANLEHYTRELRLSEHVLFTGYVPREKLVDYYRSADVFVYASKTDTQGIVLTEAMAAGLPVVAVGALGVLEAVYDGETGLLVPDDEEIFARTVLDLLASPARREQLRRNSKARAYEISAQRSTEKIVQIFQELRAAKRAATAEPR
jgi:glycosyltransferase involved in cell wall biosynthesis